MKYKLIQLIAVTLVAAFVWQPTCPAGRDLAWGQVKGLKWGQVVIENCKRYKETKKNGCHPKRCRPRNTK